MELPWWYWPVGMLSLASTYLALCIIRVRANRNAAGYLFDKPRWLWGPGWHLAWYPFTKVKEFPSALETIKVTVS